MLVIKVLSILDLAAMLVRDLLFLINVNVVNVILVVGNLHIVLFKS